MNEYKLYAVKLTEIKNDRLKEFEHSLIPFGRAYALIFTNKPLEKPFVEIPPETQLTEQERQFVMGCKLQINAKVMRENETEITEGLNSLIDELEKALAEEQQKIGEKKMEEIKKPTSKFKVGDTVYFVHIKGYGETLEEARKLQVIDLKIKRIYSGKRKITYYFANTKLPLGEDVLFATREQAEKHLKELQERHL